MHKNLHALVCNSNALKRVGITEEKEVEGGKILCENGEPTGMLIDTAMKPILDATKKEISKQKNLEEILITAQKECLEVGLTSIHDAYMKKPLCLLMDKYHKLNLLKMRIYGMEYVGTEEIENYVNSGFVKYKTDFLNLSSIKIITDGALGSDGAFLKEPYTNNPKSRGIEI